MGFLRRNCHNRDVSTGGNYFGDFIRKHRNFEFSLVRIYDGTRHIMVDQKQHDQMRGELEAKTGATLPAINPTDMTDQRNAIERKRFYMDAKQFNRHLEELSKDNFKVHQR
jgi:hypothetical protein